MTKNKAVAFRYPAALVVGAPRPESPAAPASRGARPGPSPIPP
eukprot:CAMPEP_0204539384 /NCGR_PEP_ID=MMETSP0661-20131031/16694_1 /ASSEMBLY_ACC=CAM_ASM_000606 /TAXON_ID=109239 /ORGANISM="Alexandrium margalefi, Strain AMGDE01CS-322" /LENGTH=42 /DNA_ID= /DNA_START= /DNA_END= /DNA_ORIENTATION=